MLHVQGVKRRELPKFGGKQYHSAVTYQDYPSQSKIGCVNPRPSSLGLGAGSPNLELTISLQTILHVHGGEIYLDNGLEIPKPQSS